MAIEEKLRKFQEERKLEGEASGDTDIQSKPTETFPNKEDQEPNIDESHLSGYIMEQLQNDISDKEDNGWREKREWDIKSYYELKNEAMKHWPWEGASAHPVPLTPTMVDTAHAITKASIWSAVDSPVRVKGVGVEDERTAMYLESLLNHQVVNESNINVEMDMTIFRTYLHGCGILKIMRGADEVSINASSQDINNIFLPIDSKGMQAKHTDHVFQMIGLNYTDLQYRKALGIYKNIDKMQSGYIVGSTAQNSIDLLRDEAYGSDLDTRKTRDLFYITECYLTYFPKNSLRPKELIVWISANGGVIHRVVENKDKIRPFAEFVAYPTPGYFFGRSLPDKLRNIQEQADYANKQNSDALDVAISPPGFYDPSVDYDISLSQRVPAGMYPMSKSNVQWAPQPPVERGFERKMFDLWSQAERLTGLIDVVQGASTKSGRTLGETEIRRSGADTRFKAILNRFEYGWKNSIDIIYQYNNLYVPRDKKLRILGYTDLQTIDELFPADNLVGENIGLGLTGKYDFKFGGNVVSEKEDEENKKIRAYELGITNPLVISNPANLWRFTNEYLAKPLGIRNFENVVSKPKETYIYTPEEFIQRVISGQYDMDVRPGIDAYRYIFEIQLFMKRETFKTLPEEGKATLMDAIRKATLIQQAERMAQLDMSIVKQGMQQGQQGMQPMPQEMEQNGGQ